MNNYCIVEGLIGADPIIRMTEKGSLVANFSIAISKKVGEKTQTTWIKIVAWNKLAEMVRNYVKKGMPINITGEITSRSYEDKNGIKRIITEIKANKILFTLNSLLPKENDEISIESTENIANIQNMEKPSVEITNTKIIPETQEFYEEF